MYMRVFIGFVALGLCAVGVQDSGVVPQTQEKSTPHFQVKRAGVEPISVAEIGVIVRHSRRVEGRGSDGDGGGGWRR